MIFFEKIMREKHIPLYTLEYVTPVSRADWLGFSIQYELQYTNLVNMLGLASFPEKTKFRVVVKGLLHGWHDDYPL